MSEVSCDVDAFAHVIGGLMDEVSGKVKAGAAKAVREGAEVGRDAWSAGAPVDTGRYADSIEVSMHRTADGPSAEVGSATLPGLPHLLEKGHALVGGGSSRAFPHVAPAADEAFDATMRALGEMEL